jgi:hypothetical protein
MDFRLRLRWWIQQIFNFTFASWSNLRPMIQKMVMGKNMLVRFFFYVKIKSGFWFGSGVAYFAPYNFSYFFTLIFTLFIYLF